MKKYLEAHEWKIIERGFDPERHPHSESIFSLGNGRMGQRANFEETYSGKSLQGTYIAGVYYPDKTKVGWWKNGYPEYFAKVLNACNFIGLDIEINGDNLDLFTAEVSDFVRELNMHEGYLKRSFKAKLANGNEIKVEVTRFLSIVDDELGAIKYSIIPLNFSGKIVYTPYLDFDVENEDSNYDEKFWEEVHKEVMAGEAYVSAKTKKLDFEVCCGMKYELYKNKQWIEVDEPTLIQQNNFVGNEIEVEVAENDEVNFYKYIAVTSSLNYEKSALLDTTLKLTQKAVDKGFDLMLKEQQEAWNKKWEKSDIRIEGDLEAQQAIRFNIFHLNQTYTGEDERLNIGPKGFTGEKYGGSTYWDTEAYCFPFFLSTADKRVARNLLVYRYKQLDKAIENAEKLGFKDGAALYPMVTMNGEECHNEWEITFEEIHRNGAIAYAIYRYIEYTGDRKYLAEYGLEVLLAIARFWAQRATFSEDKQKYVILGVTGPNEYENNVNNNWYTNYIACWVLRYTSEALSYVEQDHAEAYKRIVEKTKFDKEETKRWKDINENMFFPKLEGTNIILQQEGFMDKEQLTVADLDPAERPINQHWSWDRILRSIFIKQADVLQGLYFFEDDFTQEEIEDNFNFYDPKTVHESSLSPCVYSIMAAKIGNQQRAYELYLRTARLDLDDYNNEVHEGLHITSMAGTWLSVVRGFGGNRVKNQKLYFNPFLPEKWQKLAFTLFFDKHIVDVSIDKQAVTIKNTADSEIVVNVFNQDVTVGAQASEVVNYN